MSSRANARKGARGARHKALQTQRALVWASVYLMMHIWRRAHRHGCGRMPLRDGPMRVQNSSDAGLKSHSRARARLQARCENLLRPVDDEGGKRTVRTEVGGVGYSALRCNGIRGFERRVPGRLLAFRNIDSSKFLFLLFFISHLFIYFFLE